MCSSSVWKRESGFRSVKFCTIILLLCLLWECIREQLVNVLYSTLHEQEVKMLNITVICALFRGFFPFFLSLSPIKFSISADQILPCVWEYFCPKKDPFTNKREHYSALAEIKHFFASFKWQFIIFVWYRLYGRDEVLPYWDKSMASFRAAASILRLNVNWVIFYT